MKKLLLFGAGKIGRSFIAQLFGHAEYEVVFVDVNRQLVQLLNSIKQFNVIVKAENQYSLIVTNYRAIHLSEKEKLFKEFLEVSLITTSVGLNALPELFPILAEALIYRFKKNPFSPVDIIIAENIRNADELFAEKLKEYLPNDYPFDQLVGLVETSIGKMVPIMTRKDLEEAPLQIFAEEYNYLPLGAKGFKNPLPEIPGLKYMTNIKAVVDRKAMIHNLGHAAAAYFGFLEDANEKFLWKVLLNKDVWGKTRATMIQSAKILLQKYPYNFTLEDLEEHIDDLLKRFENKALGDTVYRVGSDLYRKLSKNDRLAGAVHLALKEKLPFDRILEALVSGFHFRATDERGKLLASDAIFLEELKKRGFEYYFRKITGIENPDILKNAIEINNKIINC